jgi:hypothetical protein
MVAGQKNLLVTFNKKDFFGEKVLTVNALLKI